MLEILLAFANWMKALGMSSKLMTRSDNPTNCEQTLTHNPDPPPLPWVTISHTANLKNKLSLMLAVLRLHVSN